MQHTFSTFLVRPRYEGRSYMCFETGFDNTCICPRVLNLDIMRKADVSPDDPEYFALKGKQPLYFFQETMNDEDRFCWNGHLLFNVHNKDAAQAFILAHEDKLDVVLSFADPDSDNYYFLIDTHETADDEESFLKARRRYHKKLETIFPTVIFHNLRFYTRALPARCYDIVDRKHLFGAVSFGQNNPIPCEKSTPKPNFSTSCIASSLANVKTSVSRWFAI